jgi:hypothetical protein
MALLDAPTMKCDRVNLRGSVPELWAKVGDGIRR